MRVVVGIDIEWNGLDPFKVEITTDPPNTKLPKTLIEALQEQIEVDLELNEPVVMPNVKTDIEAVEGN